MSPTGEVSVCPPGVVTTDFWPAVKITLFFAVTTVILETLLGIMMALIVNGHYRGRGLVRSRTHPVGNSTAVTIALAIHVCPRKASSTPCWGRISRGLPTRGPHD